MKKRNKNIFIIIIVCTLAILGIVYYLFQLNTSFQKVVLDQLNGTDITSIEITRSTSTGAYELKRITVTDKNVIKEIMNDFSGIKLRKSSSSQHSNKYHYSLTFVQNKQMFRFVIWVYDNKYIQIYDEDNLKQHSHSYKITNTYRSESLENLFLKAGAHFSVESRKNERLLFKGKCNLNYLVTNNQGLSPWSYRSLLFFR